MKKVLIAEDERPMANALSLKLQSVGLKTQIVYDGEAATTALKKLKYDLLVLDLVMPRKDGFYVLQELRKLKTAPPVIVISNLGQEDDKKKAKALGVRDYLIKSDTTLAMIIEQVKRVLEM
jgi:DNA-binding response OmpR family regulator